MILTMQEYIPLLIMSQCVKSNEPFIALDCMIVLMYNERPLKQNAPVVGDLKDCLEHDISSQVRCWVIFWLEYLDMALGTHSRKCHIKLPMGEKVLSQVNSHRF